MTMEDQSEDDAVAKDSGRTVRNKQLTEKGLTYQLDIKLKQRERVNQKLSSHTKRMKSVLDDDVTSSEMHELFSHWMTLYEQFLDSSEEYNVLLQQDQRQKDIDDWLWPRKQGYLQFKDDMEKWFANLSIRNLEQKFTDTEVELKAYMHSEALSQYSRPRSNASSKRSSVVSARIREEQKMAELEAKATKMKRLKILEETKLRLKMEEQELELEAQIAASQARTKVLDRYEDRSQRLRSNFSSIADLNNPPRHPPPDDGQQAAAAAAAVAAVAAVASQLNPNAAPFDTKLRPVTDTQKGLSQMRSVDNPISDGVNVVEAKSILTSTPHQLQTRVSNHRFVDNPRISTVQDNPRISSVQDNPVRTTRISTVQDNPIPTPRTRIDERTMQGSAHRDETNYGNSARVTQTLTDSALTSVVRHLRKPVCDIKKFGGDPLEYKKFLRQFESQVVSNCDSYDERLNFLDQYTYGECNKIVRGFTFLDAKTGYEAALSELADRYGDPIVVVNAYVKKALNWPTIKAEEVKGLDEFSIFLTECLYAVQDSYAVRVLEYSDNLKTLVSKLPYYIHDKWRNVVKKCKEERCEITLYKLVELVKTEATKVNDPIWGREAMGSSMSKGKSVSNKSGSKQQKKSSYATVVPNTKKDDAATSKEGSTKQGSETKTVRRNAFSKPCWHCSQDHPLAKCPVVSSLPFTERSEIVRVRSLCFGCLKYGHQKRECRNKAKCEQCEGRHPTLFHTDKKEQAVSANPTSECEEKKLESVSACAEGLSSCMGAGEGECTMAIIPVRVKLRNGAKSIPTYAFLDPGSSVSFCSEELMNRLGAGGKQMKITVNTLGEPHHMTTHILKDLEVCDLDLNHSVKLPSVYTKSKMPVSKAHIPTMKDLSQWSHLSKVNLPEIDANIDLLIGNNVPDVYAPIEVLTGPPGSPHAVQSALGWITWNVVREKFTEGRPTVNRAEVKAYEELQELRQLNKLVQQTMNMDFSERLVDDKDEMSQEDRTFMSKVSDSIKVVNGHYQIPLPFKKSDVHLPDNKASAIQRLKSLKVKIEKDPKYSNDYKTFMTAMLDKGFAEEVPEEEIARQDGLVWYIPHHGVYHPKKDKIRVVFDCGAQYQGVSLNSELLQGPNLTNTLLGVLLRFRQKPIAILSDIESMFYQVTVPREQCDCLRFIWWPEGDTSKQPKVYRMLVHIFGAASSPRCANFALRQTAQDSQDLFPVSAEAIKTSFYVDDFLKSVDTEKEAVQLFHELSQLCQIGGFHLTKWMSNNREVLEAIPAAEQAKDVRELNLEKDELPSERTLGVSWSAETDQFGFQIGLKDLSPTRRNILSLASSVFDPIGFAAPFVLQAKMILQELCRANFSWDDQITGELLKRWTNWLEEVPKLQLIAVNRCLEPPNLRAVVSRQIHIFADASEQGYGVVAYLRLITEDNQVYCSFLMAKSRVAPLKTMTIPRLELTAATVAVRLHLMLQSELESKAEKTYFWTDSMAVIRYIANENKHFKTFVANRLAVIREATTVDKWRYIDTSQNPADDASRGMSASQLLLSSHWLEGPAFLKQLSEFSDQTTVNKDIPEDDMEVKQEKQVHAATEVLGLDKLINFYSDWWKLKKAVGWILYAMSGMQKWVKKRKQLLKEQTTPDPSHKDKVERKLTKEKQLLASKVSMKDLILPDQYIQEAEKIIIRHVQQQQFKDEIRNLNESQPEAQLQMKKSSPLSKLNHNLHEGIVRVGRRSENSELDFESKLKAEHRNLAEEDVVFIVENTPRHAWSLGRVMELFPDKLKTKTSVLHRPVDKLCLVLENDM